MEASGTRRESAALPSRRSCIIALAAVSLTAPAFAKSRLIPLFNHKTFDGWTPVGDANWQVSDGVIWADKGKGGFLVSAESYRDFQLRAEFWVSPDANSGIFIRCEDPAKPSAVHGYEVNIYDTRPDPSYGTGAIVDVAKVSPMPKAGGRWNIMTIRAQGDTFSVELNGRKTVDSARDAKHAEGVIGLQYGAGVVKFRSVEIARL